MARTFEVEDVTYLTYQPWDPTAAGQKVADRDPQRDAVAAPGGAVAFAYYDVVEVLGDVDDDIMEAMEAVSVPRNVKTYYINGKVMDFDTASNDSNTTATLLANMRVNGWPAVVRCANGLLRPFHPGEDELVTVG